MDFFKIKVQCISFVGMDDIELCILYTYLVHFWFADCKLEETNYAAQSFTPSSLPLNPNRVCTNTNSFSIGVCYGFCSDEGYKCDGTYHTVFVDIACRSTYCYQSMILTGEMSLNIYRCPTLIVRLK